MGYPIGESLFTREELQALVVANEDHWLADDHLDVVLRCVRRLAMQITDLKRLASIEP
jgi:hypothetical protein